MTKSTPTALVLLTGQGRRSGLPGAHGARVQSRPRLVTDHPMAHPADRHHRGPGRHRELHVSEELAQTFPFINGRRSRRIRPFSSREASGPGRYAAHTFLPNGSLQNVESAQLRLVEGLLRWPSGLYPARRRAGRQITMMSRSSRRPASAKLTGPSLFDHANFTQNRAFSLVEITLALGLRPSRWLPSLACSAWGWRRTPALPGTPPSLPCRARS